MLGFIILEDKSKEADSTDSMPEPVSLLFVSYYGTSLLKWTPSYRFNSIMCSSKN